MDGQSPSCFRISLPQGSEWARLRRQLRPLPSPLVPLSLPEVLKEPKGFQWILVTSPEAAKTFLEGWEEAGRPKIRLAVVGGGTAKVFLARAKVSGRGLRRVGRGLEMLPDKKKSG